MSSHWTDRLFAAQQDSDYANWPHNDNIHVRRLADAQRCLKTIRFADAAIEAERQRLIDKANAIREKIAETQVSMVVAGSWNAGKSTLINAFLCENWMPTNVNRETVTVNRILDGKRCQLRAVFRDGRPAWEPQDDYRNAEDVHQKIQNLGRKHHSAIERIDVFYPGHTFLKGCAIIDTPGLDFSTEDSIVSQPLIDEADVLLWVMHLEGPRDQDHRALRTFRQRSPESQILAVVNYADMLGDDEYAETLDDKRERLSQTTDAVFLVSAKRDLAQKGSDPGFNILRAYLNEQILPAWILKQRRPSKLAGDFVDQVRAFAETASSQPLKAFSPCRIHQTDCWTARELAIALSKHWDVAHQEYGNISQWLKNGLKDQILAQSLDDFMADRALSQDERIFRLLVKLAPDRPPIWRGVSLAPADLASLAYRAEQQSQDARSQIKDIYERKVFEMCVRGGLEQYGPIHARWKSAMIDCREAWARAEKMATPFIPAPDAPDWDSLLCPLLMLQLPGHSDQFLRKAVKMKNADLHSIDYVTWFKALGQIEAVPAALLPLMLAVAPAAKEQDFWGQTTRSNKSEDYEKYLERYPQGRFANEARKKLSKLLQAENVKKFFTRFLPG